MEIQEERQSSDMVQDENLEPKVGQLFKSESEAFECYRTYAMSVGFGVVIKNSRKNADGMRCHIIYACQRAGKFKSSALNPVKAQPTTKTECKAQMIIALQFDGKWMVKAIKLNHNHVVDPRNAKYLRSNRSIPTYAKMAFEKNGEAGIRVNKTMVSCVIEAGGRQNLTYSEKDMRNHMDRERRLNLKEGDAEAMFQYFRKMQGDNMGFFYSIDVDKEHRLRNVFWADARSREAYKEFGDVVTFDTTYLVNRFDMPFAPFVGVNHHGQSGLFGCGLVTNEDTDSFVWLFKSWLECMSNRYPNAIITDQCRAMQNAISQVFPETRHRWCLWHIMKKIPDKFKSYVEYETIKFKLKNAVYDSLMPNDFEQNWQRLLEEHKLEDHTWLRGLYEERNRWVPAFVKDTFWAGMSTTQRSESMNAFFDGYVRGTTTLKEFVEQYENALGSKVEKEKEEDGRSMNVQLQLISAEKFEEQFQEAYTLTKYAKFRDELAANMGCNLTVGPVVDGSAEFIIKQKVLIGKKKSPDEVGRKHSLDEVAKKIKKPYPKIYFFIVHYNEDSRETNCNCWMFESKGMVCAHMISVWSHMNIEQVPEKYILRRWKKNVVRSHTNVKVSYVNKERKPEWHRYNHIQNIAREAADKAMLSDTKTAIVMCKLTEAIEMVDKFKDEDGVPMSIDVQTYLPKYLQVKPTTLGDPAKGVRRGRPRGSRLQSEMEKMSKKKSTKSGNNNQGRNADVGNEDTECYRPSFTHECMNFYPSQISIEDIGMGSCDLSNPPFDWEN